MHPLSVSEKLPILGPFSRELRVRSHVLMSTTPRSQAQTRAPKLDSLTLERARRGERTAQQVLVVTYQTPVFALLSRMGAPDVEDLAQETFLRVFRALPDFDLEGSAKLQTWILTIATRLAIDALRKERPDGPVADVLQLPAAGGSPASALDRKRLGRRIAAAVESLPPVYRAAFILRAYHELSLKEIAQSLECDVNTVKSRLARAKNALRGSLSRGAQDE